MARRSPAVISATGLIAALFASAIVAYAEVKLPTLQVGSEVYSNVTVWNKTATDIYFTHSRGMGNAKLKSLDPEMQKVFGYDPAIAGETEKRQAEANAAYRLEVQSTQSSVRSTSANTADSTTSTGAAGGAADIPVPSIHARSFRNRQAPALVVEKWMTPKPDYEGKFLLIDFWATWCGPCRRSIPELNALHAKFKDRLVIVGLSDESEDDVRKMTSPKIEYFVAIDPSGKTRNEVEVRGIPHAILMDPKGIVRFEGHPGYLTAAGVAGILNKYSQ